METFLNLPTQLWSLFADLNLPFILSAIVLVLIVENYWAAEKEQSLAGVTFNTKYTILYLAVALLTQPLLAYTTGLVIQACGGSWYTPRFHFKSEALNQLALGFTYLFIFDFFYYWLHRLQHRVPILWSQHKFHHSDTAVNASTTYRHHLLEEPLRMLFVLIPLGIVFTISPVTAGVMGVFFSSLGFFVHANVRLHTSYLSYLISGPQLHRIHHSREPQHFDKNFASFFPVYDILFGTFYFPAAAEYPATGLSSGEEVHTLHGALRWPFLDWWNGTWRSGFLISKTHNALSYFFGMALLALSVLMVALFIYKPVTLAPWCKLGETVYFRAGDRGQSYLMNGWTKSGLEMTWNKSSPARLALRTSADARTLSLVVQAFILPHSLPQQHLRILDNNTTVYDAVLDAPAPQQLLLQLSINSAEPGLHILTFETPDGISLQALGLSKDTAVAAIAVLKMQIS